MKINSYLKNLTCLYVEDEDFIRESFTLMLNRYFKKVFVAENGEVGLELYKKYKPDIIISDIRMPVIDGIEMAKKIKEINPKSYIIFITAFSDNEYLKAAIELGVEGYLTKPIDRKALIKKLNFLAEIIKNEREREELFDLLKLLFDMQLEASILYEKNTPKLCNKKFINIFGKCMDLEELIEKYQIDLNIENQIIYQESDYKKTYEVRIQKINEKYIIISFHDITNYENEIFIDELTKVFNRKYLSKAVEKLIAQKGCFILIDIDYFKHINDKHGHPIGDMVLINFAKILKENLRKNDTIIRVGGEEFLIILDNVKNTETAKKIAYHIKEAIEKSDFNGIKVTASCGVCCGEINNMSDYEKIYKKADMALYKAKESGRNQVKVCK